MAGLALSALAAVAISGCRPIARRLRKRTKTRVRFFSEWAEKLVQYHALNHVDEGPKKDMWFDQDLEALRSGLPIPIIAFDAFNTARILYMSAVIGGISTRGFQ